MKRYFGVLFTAAIVIWVLSGCGAHESEKTHSATGEKEAAADQHAHEETESGTHEGEHDEAESAHQGETAYQLISFSSQMQRDFSIRTEAVQKRAIHETIRALGEVKAAGTKEAEVVAPFAGMLLPDAERGIVRPGQRVVRGEHLAIIAPSTEQGGWHELLGEYWLAKAESDRVTKLGTEGAIAPKRMQEAQLDLTVKEARLRAALGGLDIGDLDSTGNLFHLRATTDGILTDVHLRYGQHVDMGEHLFNIVDPSKIWLEANVSASEADRLDEIRDAYFSVSGSETIHRTADYNGRLITVGGLLDPETRRVPVIFECDNPDNRFKPGSFAQIYLRRAATRSSLAVPQSAIVDEDGFSVAMIQVGPEDFRKVVLTTGVKDEDNVEVLTGVAEGDRIVTSGAYKVMLAATKTGGGDAHAGHGH